jgi:hypothetical protein
MGESVTRSIPIARFDSGVSFLPGESGQGICRRKDKIHANTSNLKSAQSN